MPYHKSLSDSATFISFLAANDSSSTLRHKFTSALVYLYTAQLIPEVSQFGLKFDSLPVEKERFRGLAWVSHSVLVGLLLEHGLIAHSFYHLQVAKFTVIDVVGKR